MKLRIKGMADQREFHDACGTVHDPRVTCAATRVPIAPEQVKPEMVQHPAHYNSSPARCKQGHPIECIDVVQHMTFNVGTAVKHLWRNGLKPGAGAVEDLRKAIAYIEFEITRLEAGDEH